MPKAAEAEAAQSQAAEAAQPQAAEAPQSQAAEAPRCPAAAVPRFLAAVPRSAKRLVYKPPCGPNPQGGFVLNNKARLSGGLLLSTSGRLPSYRMAAAS